MALQFQIDTASDPIVIRLSGGLTLGPQLAQFARQANAVISGETSGVILDFSAVTEIDSAGLGELVVLYTAGGKHSCRLCLAGTSDRINRLFETTRLSGILPQFFDLAAARKWLAAR